MIKDKPPCMPPFVKETKNFFVFRDVTTVPLTIDALNSDMLKQLYNELIDYNVRSKYNYFTLEPLENFYVHSYRGKERIFCTKLAGWLTFTNPKMKHYLSLGVTMEEESAIAFYTYNDLTSLTKDDQDFLMAIGNYLSTEYQKPFEIRNI